MSPGLQNEAQRLRGHDVHSLVVKDHQDPQQVTGDDGLGVRAHGLGGCCSLQLVEFRHAIHHLLVIRVGGLEVRQFGERSGDGFIERRGLGLQPELHSIAFQIGVSLYAVCILRPL